MNSKNNIFCQKYVHDYHYFLNILGQKWLHYNYHYRNNETKSWSYINPTVYTRHRHFCSSMFKPRMYIKILLYTILVNSEKKATDKWKAASQWCGLWMYRCWTSRYIDIYFFSRNSKGLWDALMTNHNRVVQKNWKTQIIVPFWGHPVFCCETLVNYLQTRKTSVQVNGTKLAYMQQI